MNFSRPDPSSRERAAIKETERNSALVAHRLQSHGGDDLNGWLLMVSAAGWNVTDRCEALGIIKKQAGEAVWRKALEVLR